jgi:hypothetical protein
MKRLTKKRNKARKCNDDRRVELGKRKECQWNHSVSIPQRRENCGIIFGKILPFSRVCRIHMGGTLRDFSRFPCVSHLPSSRYPLWSPSREFSLTDSIVRSNPSGIPAMISLSVAEHRHFHTSDFSSRFFLPREPWFRKHR